MLNNELLLAEKHLFFMDMTSSESNSTELKVLAVCNIEQIMDGLDVCFCTEESIKIRGESVF